MTEQPSRYESYEEAGKLRKRGTLGNITDNIVGGNSVGGSFKKGISDTFKAKVTGIKEKFDPINIAKSLTGNLGGATIGKLTGRSSEDMAYFLGDKARRKNPNKISTSFYTTVTRATRLKKSDNLSDVALKLFSFMKKANEEKIKNYELDKSFEKTKHEKDEKRHNELIEAIKESKVKEIPEKIEEKPKEEKPSKPDVPDLTPKKSVETIKPPTTAKPVESVAPPKTTTPSPEAPTITPPKTATPRPEAPTVAPPKTTTPEVSPSVLDRVRNFLTSKPAATAAKVGGAAVAVGATADVIAKEEGFASKGYWDPPNQRTLVSIGYGHQIQNAEYNQGYIQAGDEQVPIKGDRGKDTVISKEQAKKLLAVDLPKYEERAKKPLGDLWNKLNDKQKTALTSYAYNTGSTQSLVNAGLGEAIKQGNTDAAADIIRDKGIRTAKGIVNPTLVARRAREAEIFRSDSKMSSQNTPPKTGDRLSSSSVQNQDLTQTKPQNNIMVNNSVNSISGATTNKQIMNTPQQDIPPIYMALI